MSNKLVEYDVKDFIKLLCTLSSCYNLKLVVSNFDLFSDFIFEKRIFKEKKFLQFK